MPWSQLLTGALASLVLGLDRTAAYQFMVSRPLVAAPLTGFLLGEPLVGLQAGALIELLWLGRLPVGAAIPPDDTQVAVAGTVLAVSAKNSFPAEGTAVILLCVLLALPLGKLGQFFDRLARNRNGRLLQVVEGQLAAGKLSGVENANLRGLANFALASVATYLTIVIPGWYLVQLFGPGVLAAMTRVDGWLFLAFPLVGTAILLRTINVSRALTLFSASFSTALLVLWLLQEGV